MLDKKNFYINGEWVSPKKSNDLNITFGYYDYNNEKEK